MRFGYLGNIFSGVEALEKSVVNYLQLTLLTVKTQAYLSYWGVCLLFNMWDYAKNITGTNTINEHYDVI